MSRRVVLFGATGHTGGLTARALVRLGLTPVLAGRSRDRLERLGADLGGLDTVVADAASARQMRGLVEPGDVLLATAGPFARLGRAALEATIAARATYIDCAAEPAFVRAIFERYGPQAEARGSILLPATGYESAPGTSPRSSPCRRPELRRSPSTSATSPRVTSVPRPGLEPRSCRRRSRPALPFAVGAS